MKLYRNLEKFGPTANIITRMADVDEDKDGKLTKTEFRLFCEKIKLADPEINVEKIVYIL